MFSDFTQISDAKLVRRNLAMMLSDLHQHLFSTHRFLQDLETPYRVHPKCVREYLDSDL